MPQATYIHTRNPSAVAVVVDVLGVPTGDRIGARSAVSAGYDGPLSSACHAALTQEVLASLTAMEAERPPDDPRHSAVYTMAETMKSRWQTHVTKACRIPAARSVAFQTKAASSTASLNATRDDQVIGNPALQLAASLAYEAWDAGD